MKKLLLMTLILGLFIGCDDDETESYGYNCPDMCRKVKSCDDDVDLNKCNEDCEAYPSNEYLIHCIIDTPCENMFLYCTK
jgi:hypothetical protein